MSVLIQIRDVDEGVRDRLKGRAAEEGVSLNTLLRQLLERESLLPSRADVLARLRERGDLVDAPSVDLVWNTREERDADLGLDRR
ncbi:MAG: hypothetical protein Q4G35_10255 [Propionibacteriaceae bacterium]|nr:hypothetical protein [Propionibacteriaceae bacterium]